MPPAIRVENLSKRYRVLHAEARVKRSYKTLREDITRLLTAPARRLRQVAGDVRTRLARAANGDAQWNGHAASGKRLPKKEDFWALKDVSFDVQPGEVVGVIGRNGAGKSTLLKILSRITAPTSGRVTLHGRVGSLLEVGTGFHQELTGRENIYLNGAILGMGRREIARKFDEIVDFSGVEKFLDTPVKRYSSGMHVRLAFAVAAHLDPEIMLVDEVLAVGDFEFQRKCLGKMSEVAHSGRTILFVSHNMPAVRRLCSRAIWLSAGTIAAQDSTDVVIDSYLQSTEHAACSVAQYPLDPTAKLQLLELALTDYAGEPLASPHDLNIPMMVRITYAVHATGVSARLTCRFKNSEGEDVLLLDSRDSNAPVSFAPGRHAVQIQLPAGILNSGTYTLAISARAGAERLLDVEGPVAVSLVDLKTHRGGRRPGYLAIKPPWLPAPRHVSREVHAAS